MKDPQNQSSEVLKNLKLLYGALVFAEFDLRQKFGAKALQTIEVDLLGKIVTASGVILAALQEKSINYESANSVYQLCTSAYVDAILLFGIEPLELLRECKLLALEVLADVPIGFILRPGALSQSVGAVCDASTFCEFLGCIGDCNRGVCDD